MTYIPTVTANVSVLNSTTRALTTPGEVFQGTPEDVSQYSSLSVSFSVQPPGATGNIFVQFSNVSTNAGWFPVSNTVTPVNSTNSNGFTLDTTMTCQYFRVMYINDSTPQTSLMIQSIYHPQARIAQKTTRFAETPTDYSDMINTRAIVWGKTLGGGVYEPIAGNGENSLVTAIVDPRTSYGDMQVAEITPVAQVDFSYGTNTVSTMNVRYGSNATVAVSSSLLILTANAVGGSSMAYLSPKKFVKYRAGQGTLARFTAMFTPNAPSQSVQFAGQGFADPTSNIVIDACGFGYVGSTFGIHYYNNSSNTFIPQASWNVDTMLGGTKSGMIINPANLNVYECKFQYLGGGNLFFYVYNYFDGRKVLVHMIQSAGTLTGTIFQNPSMRIMWYSNSYAVGTNTPVVVKGASCGHFIEGQKTYNGPKGGVSNYYHNLPTDGAKYCIFAVKNAQFYNGVVNRSQLHFRNVSISVAGGAQNIGLFSVLKNPTISTISLWTAYNGTGTNGITITNGQSTAFSNVASGITVTGGNTIFTLALGSTPSNAYADLTDYDIVAYPGDTVAFVISVPSGGAVGDYGSSVTWSEDL